MLQVFYEDNIYVEKTGPWVEKYIKRVGITVKQVDDFLVFLQNEPTKLLAMGEETVLQEIRKKFIDRDVYLTRSLPNFLEILNFEATKGRGLAALIKMLAIAKEQVLVIGDNQNDIEMFRYAGHSVVMDNADDEIKAHADYVTSSNDDDGVAEAIEKLVLA